MRFHWIFCIVLLGFGFFRSLLAFPPSPDDLADLHKFGHRIHAMVQACQSPEDKVNIFIPKVTTKEGQLPDFLKRKGKICVFASGGLSNAWEKTVSHAYHVLYGDRIKIIRASWVMKHLDHDLERTYKKAPRDLHSELFFKLYADKFKRGIREVWGFSWWRPCDHCHDLLAKMFQGPVQCHISYVKPYQSTYERTHSFSVRRIGDSTECEKGVWEDLWQKVLSVTREHSEQAEEAKRAFWAENYEGICLTKWLAQAFVCPSGMKVGLEAPDLTPQVDVGKISPHLSGARAEDVELISKLVVYLRDVNWELSCWFKPPFPESIQKNWLKYWLRAVVPHFAWKEVGSDEDKEAQSVCEMCGNKGLRELFFVYHPKHTPSQEAQPPLDYKVKKSLTVGSECVVHLTMRRDQVEEDQQKALAIEEERRPKRRAEAARKQEYLTLELAEKELKRQEREEKLEEQALKKKLREEKSRAKETKSRTPRKRKDFDDVERDHAAGTPREKKKKR